MPSYHARIIYDNAADRATLVASSEASTSMAVANLKTNSKAEILRSVGSTQTITATWPSAETIGGVVLAKTSLTGTATIRVRGYTNAADAVPLFDTTDYACAGPAMQMWNWGAGGLGANAYAYGGGAYGRVWIPVPGSVQKLVIDISDPGSTTGYIDIARLICGAYWSPEKNFVFGNPLTPMDTSEHYRTENGDLNTDNGIKYRKQSFDMQDLTPADASIFWNIVMGNGKSKPVFISLFPQDADTTLEQRHQIFGKLSTLADFTIPSLQRYASTIEQEEF